MRRFLAVLVACLLAGSCASAPRADTRAVAVQRQSPNWQAFERAAFERAEREHKLILLSVQAGWCHWCHVMNATTYRDPRVLAHLERDFVVIRVEQDQRPDLAERYAAWGWPATALLSPSASPILTLRGHQPPERFAGLLSELVAERDSGKPFRTRDAAVSIEKEPAGDLGQVRDFVLAQLDAVYDERAGGWGTPQKYPFAAPVQHALLRAAFYRERARLEQVVSTLRGHAQLIDPVAGGMFQYSLRGRWDAPHYEKIAAIQATAIESFADAYRATRDPEFLANAEQVASYVLSTLRDPSGAFYASQDADVGHVGQAGHLSGDFYYSGDAPARSRRSAPKVDQSIYANLNGMMIRALCALYRASGNTKYAQAARQAFEAVRKTHARGDAFLHQAADTGAVFYLSDQVEMAAAMLSLSEADLEPSLARMADATIVWSLGNLGDDGAGALFAHTQTADSVGVFNQRTTPYADNGLMARLLLQRARARDEAPFVSRAHAILLALGDRARIRAQGRKIGDYLVALEYALGPSMMVSIVGPADDERTRALHQAAYVTYLPQAFVEVARPNESRYPYTGVPAAYFCSDNACSEPITDAATLPIDLASFAKLD